jgi:hypothetical protein
MFTFFYSLAVAVIFCATNIIGASAMEEALYPYICKNTPPGTPEKTPVYSPEKPTPPKRGLEYATPPATPKKLDSQNCSPCEQTPQKLEAPSARTSTRVLRSLDFGPPENSVYQDIPVAKEHFEAALQQARRCDAPSGENHPPRYLCALLSPESEAMLEEALMSLLKKTTRSRTIDRILNHRIPHTVLDFSTRDSSNEKRFHMSFSLPDSLPSDEELERLRRILPNIEFSFSHLECMGRFMAIMLSNPCAKYNELCVEDMEFLGKYLQHDGGKPVMHVSLIMINSSREEMECISPQSPNILVPIPDSQIEFAIKSAENMKGVFNPREFKQTLSGLFLNYLFEICKETRDYAAEVASENKSDLYLFLCRQANIVLQTLPDLQELTRVYFRKTFNADFDFTGKLHLDYNGIKTASFDAQAINSLLSKIFLSSDKPEFESFKDFQKLAGFFIDETRKGIAEREQEISCGRTIIDSDNFDPFESDLKELTQEEKLAHEKQNHSDHSVVRKVEEELSTLFVMRYLFGIPFEEGAFCKFVPQEGSSLQQFTNKTQFEEPQEKIALLDEIARLLVNITQTNLFHPDFIIDDSEPFQNFVGAFVHFNHGVEQELKETIARLKDLEIATLKEVKGNCCKEVSFLNSQIPNPLFWHKFWHVIEKVLPQTLQGVNFSFASISFQPRVED